MFPVKRIVTIPTALSAFLILATALAAAQPAPAPSPPPPVAAPWANKFFLPDIATNREQAPPAVITHNFGEVPHGTLCVHKFTITNIYDTPMQILEVRKSCTCLDYVPMDKVLQPNETAEFIVTMNTAKFVGHNAQTFYVTFGPKYISTAVIRVSATSRTEVSLNPGAINFGTVPQGSRLSQSITVKYSGRNRDWRITEAVPTTGPLEVRFGETYRGGPLRGGAEYAVEVSLKPSAAAGPISEQITLKTSDPNNPLIQIGVTGNIVAPLELSPPKVRLEAHVGREPVTQRVLVRAAKPFKITAVDGAVGDLTVDLPATPAALPVQVITLKYQPKQAGIVLYELRVRTDLPGELTATLPVEVEGLK
ncbi:MAG: DUF1573 domain-containing protein [Gemmataceae bacterium]|nr:DUF1573 domain-containing protein [Gemmata sp.]MDW8198435.1 DUF1573 domain-containing protein [Gemmataceae bacterium]